MKEKKIIRPFLKVVDNIRKTLVKKYVQLWLDTSKHCLKGDTTFKSDKKPRTTERNNAAKIHLVTNVYRIKLEAISFMEAELSMRLRTKQLVKNMQAKQIDKKYACKTIYIFNCCLMKPKLNELDGNTFCGLDKVGSKSRTVAKKPNVKREC